MIVRGEIVRHNIKFSETIFYTKWSNRITKLRFYIAVFFIKCSIFIIDKNTNDGLSYIVAIRNWIDYLTENRTEQEN